MENEIRNRDGESVEKYLLPNNAMLTHLNLKVTINCIRYRNIKVSNRIEGNNVFQLIKVTEKTIKEIFNSLDNIKTEND